MYLSNESEKKKFWKYLAEISRQITDQEELERYNRELDEKMDGQFSGNFIEWVWTTIKKNLNIFLKNAVTVMQY